MRIPIFVRLVFGIMMMGAHVHAAKGASYSYPANNDTKITRLRRFQNYQRDENFDQYFPVVRDDFYEFDVEEGDNTEEKEIPDFEPLCQHVRRKVEMKSDTYEYFPKHYYEIVCRIFTTTTPVIGNQNQMCLEPGFTCVQRMQTIFLTRKRHDSDCWQSSKEVIASGCECMWPEKIRDS